MHAASVLDGGLGLTGDQATGVEHRPEVAASSRCAGSPRTPGSRATSSSTRSRELPVGHGLNAATDAYGDLVADGVIDPVKVTRSALQNAASIVGLLLTTETLVVEKPAEDDSHAEGGHGHCHGPGGHSH